MAETQTPSPGLRRRTVDPLMRLWPYLRKRVWFLIAGACALLASSALTLTFPIAFRRVIDQGIGSGDDALIDQYFLALLAVVAALALATAIRFYLVSKIGERLVADLRASLFGHLVRMNPGFLEEMRTGEVLSCLTADMTVVQNMVDSVFSIALRNGLLLVGAALMMLITSPKLALITVFLVPMVIVPLVLMGRRVRELSRASQDRIAHATGVIGEALQELAIVQAFTAERVTLLEGNAAIEEAYRVAGQRIRLRARLTALVIFLVATGVVVVAWVGAQDVAQAHLTPGTLVQFVFYAVFVGAATGSLAEVWGVLQLAAGAVERIFALLAAQPTIAAPSVVKALPSPVLGDIAFPRCSLPLSVAS